MPGRCTASGSVAPGSTGSSTSVTVTRPAIAAGGSKSRLFGTPFRRNPPTASVAPSGTSATASTAVATTLSMREALSLPSVQRPSWSGH